MVYNTDTGPGINSVFEFAAMVQIRTFGIKWFAGMLGVLLLFLPLFISGYEQIQLRVLLALVLFFITSTVFSEGFSIEKAGTMLMGALYIGFGFVSLAEARLEEGVIWTFAILISIWASDSGAYFVGRKFGRRKLAEKISPNKTIEGSIGGVVTAIIFGVLLQIIVNPFESYLEVIMIPLVVAVAGQVGDLVESALKRHYGVKDSGKILPGHGGILDRLDSWIFVFIGLKLAGII